MKTNQKHTPGPSFCGDCTYYPSIESVLPCYRHSAAPELLDALKIAEALCVSRKGRWNFEDQIKHNKIKAAILKAEGKEAR